MKEPEKAQKQSPSSLRPHPALAFRVGITGARHLPAHQLPRLRDRVNEVLKLVQRQLEIVAPQPRVRNFYATTCGVVQPVVRFISPLAHGADRLAARVALDLKIELNAVLPFPESIYEDDFIGSDPQYHEKPMSAKEDVDEFRELRKAATTVLTLDGGRNSQHWLGGDQFADLSYEAAGHFVVRHCDLLIAIWDGREGNGRGGTQEMVEYATRAGVPVWWIHATQDIAPHWITNRLDLRGTWKNIAARQAVPAEECLTKHIDQLIPAPHERPAEETDLLGLLVRIGRRHEPDQVAEYFAEKPRKKRSWIWGHDKRFMESVVGEPAPVWPQSTGDDDCCPKRYWAGWYDDASQWADTYTPRYRTAYTLGLQLALFSVCVGAFLSIGEHHWQVAVFEFVPLLAVVVLLWHSLRHDWHRRSIEYRLLSELFRAQAMLAELGWALPINGVHHLADEKWLSWVPWLLAAVQRASPFPPCRITETGAIKVNDVPVRALVHKQIEYHENRARFSKLLGNRLEKAGTTMFAVVAALAVLKILMALSRHGTFYCGCIFIDEEAFKQIREGIFIVLEILGALATSLSAFCLAMRSYKELRLLTEQSKVMQRDLQQALGQLDRISKDRPLASHLVGAEASAVALIMLNELEGWGRLFRGKLLETP